VKRLQRKKEIGILGGSFDPITKGHIQVAQYALDNCQSIDEVWLSPCFKHMHDKKMVSPKHRLKMCELADKGDYNIGLFDFEIKSQFSGSSFELFTQLLKEPIVDDYNLNLIVGLDNAENFHKWKDFNQLEKLVRFIIVPRAGVDTSKSKVSWYKKPPHIFLETKNNGVMKVSSTLVRKELRIPNSTKIKEYIDKNVHEYVINNGLYIKKWPKNAKKDN